MRQRQVTNLPPPGVKGGDNGTLRLDMGNEPQPDAYLRILESHGGQARLDEKGYVTGAPELLAEVALSSVILDAGCIDTSPERQRRDVPSLRSGLVSMHPASSIAST